MNYLSKLTRSVKINKMKLNELVKSYWNSGIFDNLNTAVGGKELVAIKDLLWKVDEFKHAEQFNIVEYPNFSVDQNGNPCTSEAFAVGEGVKTLVFKFGPNIEFSKTIDLYSIVISPPIIDNKCYENLPSGVWNFPILLTPGDWQPYREIRIRWTPGNLQDEQGGIQAIEDTLKKVKEALTSDKINIPHHRDIMLRMSPRSVITTHRDNSDCIIKFNEV